MGNAAAGAVVGGIAFTMSASIMGAGANWPNCPGRKFSAAGPERRRDANPPAANGLLASAQDSCQRRRMGLASANVVFGAAARCNATVAGVVEWQTQGT